MGPVAQPGGWGFTIPHWQNIYKMTRKQRKWIGNPLPQWEWRNLSPLEMTNPLVNLKHEKDIRNSSARPSNPHSKVLPTPLHGLTKPRA